MKRKVAIFTGNRAEFGLQYPILKAIAADPRFEYLLLVSGAHLNQDFGRTLSEIEAEGFTNYQEVSINMPPDDTLVATAAGIGSGVINICHALAKFKPDFVVVYADRFESFAAAIASTQMGLATAHLEGGDYTEGGALDDSVRHAISKLAHIHFTTNEDSTERVRRMGEENWRIFNVGYPGLDLIAAKKFAQPDEVYSRFNLDPKRPILLFTQHSVATEFTEAAEQIKPSLEALEYAAKEWGCQAIITYPNDDAGGRRIIKEIEALAARKVPGIQVQKNLGRHFYHGTLNVAAACIGNSSSGIKETPAFHCPSIDIGARQRGRLQAGNVIAADYDRDAIVAAIKKALFDEDYKQRVKKCVNPYGGGNAGPQIADVLATIEMGPALIQKKMTY